MLVFEGEYLKVFKRNNWEYVERKKATGIAGIIAITDDLKLVLIEQYREPVQKICIEIPAGLVGDKGPETILEGAHRELLEETGYNASKMRLLGDFPVSPGSATEVLSLILASDLKKTNHKIGDETENIKVIEIPILSNLNVVMSLSQNGQRYIDCKVFAAIYLGQFEITRRMEDGSLTYKDAISSF